MELKKETENLLNELQSMGFNRSKVEEELLYKPNYIAQQLSKGSNSTLVAKLKKLKEQIKNRSSSLDAYVEYDVASGVKKTEAMAKVTMSAIAELLAIAKGQTTQIILSDLEELVNRELSA